MQDLIQQLASELDKDPRHVENVVRLLDEGNTIPFIARYRKELHGAMDDTALRNLEERLQYLRNLAERREAVKRSIEEQGKLTEELSAAIDAARTLAEVEDLYRPYKQKRRLWRSCCLPRGRTARTRRRRPPGMWMPKRAWRRWRTPSPAPPTSSPRPSATTPPSARPSAPS